jgi:hypothetical protein
MWLLKSQLDFGYIAVEFWSNDDFNLKGVAQSAGDHASWSGGH